jgi:hypothetical protein
LGLTILFKISIFEFFFLFPFLTYYYAPFISEINVLNVNIIQLGFLAFFILCYNFNHFVSKIISGITIGILIAFKPNVALPICFFLFGILVDKNYFVLKPILIGILWGGILSIIISGCWINHLSAWLDWFRSISDLFSNNPLQFVRGNYSLYKFVEELLSKRIAQIISALLILIGLILIWIKRDKNEINNNEKKFFDRDLARLGIGFIISFLAAGLSWIHYFLLLIPFVLFLFRDSTSMMNSSKFFGIFIFLSFFSILPYILSKTLNSEVHVNNLIGISFILGSLLLIILLYQEINNSRLSIEMQ